VWSKTRRDEPGLACEGQRFSRKIRTKIAVGLPRSMPFCEYLPLLLLKHLLLDGLGR
jgi:hypothetical protein